MKRWYCRNCAYELTELAKEGVCPECGGAYAADQRKGFRVRASRRVCWWPMWFAPVVFGAGLFADDFIRTQMPITAFVVGVCWIAPLAGISLSSVLARGWYSNRQLWAGEIIPVGLYVVACTATFFIPSSSPDTLTLLALIMLPFVVMMYMSLLWLIAIGVTGFIEKMFAR